MLLALGYHQGDLDQAERLSGWINELGGAKGHTLLLVRDRNVNGDEQLQANFKQAFDEVTVINPTPDAWHKWPESANNVFACTARHIEYILRAPFWLWLEPDVVPLREGWINALQKEYESANRPFMADDVNVNGVPRHASGVAIYPGRVVDYAGLALISHETAWDVAAKDQIVPQCHFTDLIAHAWDRDLATGKGNRVFENYEQVEREVLQPHPNAVIFHADKSGTAIQFLRERRVAKQVNATDLKSVETTLAGSNPAPSTDIFIKTYPADYKWLGYSLRSMEKFCSEFRKIVIVSHDALFDLKTDFSIHLSIPVDYQYRFEFGMGSGKDEKNDNYLSQQVFKLKADELTDANFLIFMDSDTQFVRPVTPETFFKDGKIAWMITPYSETKAPWKPITEKFLKMPIEYETMRRHPIVVPRWLLSEVRDFCQKTHNMSIEEYVMSQPAHEFSEFNVLGAYAYHFHRDKFHWVDTSKVPENEWPILTVNQEWSHNPLDDVMRAKLEAIVSANEAPPVSSLTTENVESGLQSPKSLGGTVPTSEKTEAICSPDAAVPPDFEVIEIGGAVSENSPHGPEIVEVNPAWKQANAETLSPSELQPEETGERSFTKERIKGMIQLSPDLYKRGEDLIALDPSKPCSLRTQTDAIGFRVDPNQTTIGKSECEVRSVSSVEKLDGKQGVKPTNDFGSDELRARMASEKPLPVPWKDKEASQKEVDHYCAVLAMFCGAPIYKKRVRDALRKVKIIP